MKIYLLVLDDGQRVFYSEGPEVPAMDENARIPRRGFRGWAERKYESLQTAINSSEGKVSLRLRHVWTWLQRRTSPDESLLRSLRNASVIKIYHPPSIKTEEARTLWANYLLSRRHRHTLWLVVNGLVSPLTVLLAPIPGPNIIGYWFLYRAICHLLVVSGVRRAISAQVSTDFHSSSALDEIISATNDERIVRLAEHFGLKKLDGFIRRVANKEGSASGTKLAVS